MKIARKISLWLVGIIFLIAIQGVILIYIYEKEIKAAAVEKLNEQINTPIKVGKIELSYFKHFPFVSLSFPDVVVYDSNPGHENVLLSAQEISLFFNIWDIYQGKYDVKKLFIDNAVWTSKIDRYGLSNFEVLKQNSTSSTSDSKFKLSIEEIIVKNSSVLHIDEESNFILRTSLPEFKAKGNFTSDEFELNLVSDLQIQNLLYNNTSFVRNKTIHLNSDVFVDMKNSSYQFSKTNILVEKMNLLLDGVITYSDQKKSIDLKSSGSNLDIQSFISLLPNKYINLFKDYQSTGNMYFESSIKGSLESNKSPLIIVRTGFKNATVIVNNEKVKNQQVDQLFFDLQYNNNATENIIDDVLNIGSFKAIYHNRPIIGNINITNLDDPLLDLAIETNQSFQEIQKIWPVKNIDFKSGEFGIKLKLKAKLSEFKKDNNIKHIESAGNILITNTELNAGKYALPIENINGSFDFQKSDLKINNLTFKIGSSDFQINGFFRNLFSFILTENEDLEIDATLASKKINIKELLSSGANSTDDEPYKLKINPRLTANLKLQVKEIQFLPFQAFDVEGSLNVKDQIVNTDYLAFRSQKGLVFAKLNFNTKQHNRMPMNIDLNLNKVDVSNMFREFQNFGINILTDKNIKGNITSTMKVNIVWDENLNSVMDAFSAKGSILIENGELLNFDPMLALGKYIDVNELKDLKFSNLENTIEIKNKMIYIPDMDIKSNALNLRLTGTHSFDNKIDYHLQMLLSDFIKKKSKNLGDERFGEIEPDGSGNTKLFVRMYGDAENPKFSLDKKEIKKKIADDFKKEKAEIKNILKDEFGSWFKKEKEFKESINEEPNEWEKDIPQSNTVNKVVPSTSKKDTLSNKKRVNLQKLKEKITEKPVEDE